MPTLVEFVRPTEAMINVIASDMRDADAAEVWASSHHTPLQSLMIGWKSSDISVIIKCNGEPMVMIGLVKQNMLTGNGIPWMLGTNASMKYKREFFNQTGPIIEEMLNVCPRLSNYVHGKNKASILWLKWLGFTIEEPIEHGPDSEIFHRFYLNRS